MWVLRVVTLEVKAQEWLPDFSLATLLVYMQRDSLFSLHSLTKIPYDGSMKAVLQLGAHTLASSRQYTTQIYWIANLLSRGRLGADTIGIPEVFLPSDNNAEQDFKKIHFKNHNPVWCVFTIVLIICCAFWYFLFFSFLFFFVVITHRFHFTTYYWVILHRFKKTACTVIVELIKKINSG